MEVGYQAQTMTTCDPASNKILSYITILESNIVQI